MLLLLLNHLKLLELNKELSTFKNREKVNMVTECKHKVWQNRYNSKFITLKSNNFWRALPFFLVHFGKESNRESNDENYNS
jgi:hypothetical protein